MVCCRRSSSDSASHSAEPRRMNEPLGEHGFEFERLSSNPRRVVGTDSLLEGWSLRSGEERQCGSEVLGRVASAGASPVDETSDRGLRA
jgi:hypothetical protein